MSAATNTQVGNAIRAMRREAEKLYRAGNGDPAGLLDGMANQIEFERDMARLARKQLVA
jgi:hypothetical protein